MKHFIAFCRRNRLFAALLAAELAVVCALAAGLFGAPYKLALTPGDFTNTLPDIAAANDDGLKIWNQIGYHSDDPMTFSAAILLCLPVRMRSQSVIFPARRPTRPPLICSTLPGR